MVTIKKALDLLAPGGGTVVEHRTGTEESLVRRPRPAGEGTKVSNQHAVLPAMRAFFPIPTQKTTWFLFLFTSPSTRALARARIFRHILINTSDS